MIKGSCVCGRVRYQVDGELEDFCHCHCSICRKIHGAAFASWGGILRDKFSWLAGRDEVNTYAFSNNADSIFCPNCSSTLLVDFKPEADMLYLAMGTVTPGSALVRKRVHRQIVGERFRVRFAGTGPGHEVGSVAIKHKSESRFNL